MACDLRPGLQQNHSAVTTDTTSKRARNNSVNTFKHLSHKKQSYIWTYAYHNVGDQAGRLRFRLYVVHLTLGRALDTYFGLSHVFPSETETSRQNAKNYGRVRYADKIARVTYSAAWIGRK